MNETLVKDAENDVNRCQRSQNQQALIGQRALKCRGGSLKSILDAGRHVELLLSLFDLSDCATQCGVWSQIERNGDRRKLALMIDRERLGSFFNMSERAERYGIGRR